MKRIIIQLSVILALSLVIVGCGKEPNNKPNDKSVSDSISTSNPDRIEEKIEPKGSELDQFYLPVKMIHFKEQEKEIKEAMKRRDYIFKGERSAMYVFKSIAKEEGKHFFKTVGYAYKENAIHAVDLYAKDYVEEHRDEIENYLKKTLGLTEDFMNTQVPDKKDPKNLVNVYMGYNPEKDLIMSLFYNNKIDAEGNEQQQLYLMILAKEKTGTRAKTLATQVLDIDF